MVIMLKKGLHVVFLIMLIVAGAEGIFWAFGYPQNYSALFTFDKDSGYRFASGQHSFISGNEQHSLRIDRYGILDHFGSGRAEVLILGDGVTAGMELPTAKRLASRVHGGTQLKTLNLSVPGYGTIQQWLAMRSWIDANGAPDHVFIVYNFTSDYFDNVPAWEGTRVPGVTSDGTTESLLAPQLPSENGQKLREILWQSRLWNLFSQLLRQVFPNEVTIPEQQKLLYSTDISPESQVGDDATQFAVKKITELREKYGFTLTWLGWRDIGLEKRAGLTLEMGSIAENRVEKLTGDGASWKHIFKDLPESPEEIKSWEEKWLYPGTNHASSEAIARIAARIAVMIQFELVADQE